MRQKRFFAGPKKTPMDEAREALAVQVLAHVPVRAPAEGAIPAIPSTGRGSLRHARPGCRRGSD